MITLLLPSTFEKIMVCNNNNFIFNKHNYSICNHYVTQQTKRLFTNNFLLHSES